MVLLIAFWRKQKPVPADEIPVSVIVCAHDEELNLRELIPLLQQQQHSNFEVIVVEDRSNDETYDYLRDVTASDSRVKMVRVQQTPDHINPKKFAITLGVKAAKNDVLVFTDADCRPVSTLWLQTMTNGLTPNDQLVLGVSTYQRLTGLLNAFIRFETLFTAIQYIGFALAGKPYMGVGRNLVYRKSLFLDNKGFISHQHITGGDDDLFVNEHAVKSNTAVRIGRDALVLSIPKTTWRAFYYQKLRHLAVGKKYKASDKFLLAIFQLTSILTWFVGLPLLTVSVYFWWVFGVLIFRWILIYMTFFKATHRFGDKFACWSVPLLDFLYPFYYISTAPVALLTKKVRWKT